VNVKVAVPNVLSNNRAVNSNRAVHAETRSLFEAGFLIWTALRRAEHF
jgi:hypothetical protein